MTAPPGIARTAEPLREHITQADDTESATYFEAWCIVRGLEPTSHRAQQRYLTEGLGCTHPQAKALIRAYLLDERDREARGVASEEFGLWIQRRGDLICPRQKRHHEWRTTSA